MAGMGKKENEVMAQGRVKFKSLCHFALREGPCGTMKVAVFATLNEGTL